MDHPEPIVCRVSTDRASLDVGVDTHDFRPWHFDEIETIMKAKAAARESNLQAERRAVLSELADYDQEIGL